MRSIIINKIEITEEAVFDYEQVLSHKIRQPLSDILIESKYNKKVAFLKAEEFERLKVKLNKYALKKEIETYMDNLSNQGLLLDIKYFKCRYFDENLNKILMLFIYKTVKFGIMQCWSLMGICLDSDWSQEKEESGAIRHWLKEKIKDLDKTDWVQMQQIRAKIDKLLGGEIIEWSISELTKEVQDAIKFGASEDIAKRLSYLSNANKEQFVRR